MFFIIILHFQCLIQLDIQESRCALNAQLKNWINVKEMNIQNYQIPYSINIYIRYFVHIWDTLQWTLWKCLNSVFSEILFNSNQHNFYWHCIISNLILCCNLFQEKYVAHTGSMLDIFFMPVSAQWYSIIVSFEENF